VTRDGAFGDVVADVPAGLTSPLARATWRAVQHQRDFVFVEARRASDSETLVVECRIDAVPTRNRLGIRYCEPLALTFYRTDRLPEVYTLRPDFPITAHQHASPKPGYRLPCLYVERWSALRRTWTAEKHLRRVTWWFSETANETLHHLDQLVEQLYFNSQIHVVLPPDFGLCLNSSGHELNVQLIWNAGRDRLTLVGDVVPAGGRQPSEYACVVVSVDPLVHGPIEPMPTTLGVLHDQLAHRGATLAPRLAQAVVQQCVDGRFPLSGAARTLLIIGIPLKRNVDGAIERTDFKGFVVLQPPAALGVALGALSELNQERTISHWAVPLLSGAAPVPESWRDCQITAVDVIDAFTSRMGRSASGIRDEGPKGVVAGAGALGSDIIDHWVRSGWGSWTIIDPDQVQPHNLARHRALRHHVGHDKALVISTMATDLTKGEAPRHAGVTDFATNLGNPAVAAALTAADLVVDVTTTLEFPRDLSKNDSVKRAVSVFITPSGRGAVMLFEDKARNLRLDSLEAQYYRHVITDSWGGDHLLGNRGHLWTGAGCRDTSAVIANELIGLHGANFAAMVRMRSHDAHAAIMIWHYDAARGALASEVYTPAATAVQTVGGLEVVWDEDVRGKVRAWRDSRLPKETGGILLCYFDLVLGRVFVADALPAPPDSLEENDGFVRGVTGLEDAVNTASMRTGHIVGYIGEWHSHPPKHPSSPSEEDLVLLAHLATKLLEDGQPPLMLIVGEDGESWFTAMRTA
jgi:hypothetical protein